jgi:hypothetical protein
VIGAGAKFDKPGGNAAERRDRVQIECLEIFMFLPSPDKAERSVAMAALSLRAGEVYSLLRQQVIGAFATVVALAALSGFAAFH